MRILMPTDVFPPRCGGAGWSAFFLARALVRAGHAVETVVPVEGLEGTRRRTYQGIPVLEVGYQARRLPFLRNRDRFEALWPRLARILAERVRAEGFDLIHGQHVQTGPAAVLAAREAGVPAVATVRDYWPLCYITTRYFGDRAICPGCGPGRFVACTFHRQGLLAAAGAALAGPYALAHTARRAQLLAQADAVVAVSRFVARKLIDEGGIPPERVHAVPNLVDPEVVEAALAEPDPTLPEGPYLLFVGKLEPNKGVRELVEALAVLKARIPRPPPLWVVGSGRLKGWLEAALARLEVPVRFAGWQENAATLRWMARARVLLFPSAWDEPLSRVLLEALAAGAPIAALATGGTPEILVDGESGLLAATARELGEAAARILTEPGLEARLREGARRRAREAFAPDAVLPQILAVYKGVRRAQV